MNVVFVPKSRHQEQACIEAKLAELDETEAVWDLPCSRRLRSVCCFYQVGADFKTGSHKIKACG